MFFFSIRDDLFMGGIITITIINYFKKHRKAHWRCGIFENRAKVLLQKMTHEISNETILT